MHKLVEIKFSPIALPHLHCTIVISSRRNARQVDGVFPIYEYLVH